MYQILVLVTPHLLFVAFISLLFANILHCLLILRNYLKRTFFFPHCEDKARKAHEQGQFCPWKDQSFQECFSHSERWKTSVGSGTHTALQQHTNRTQALIRLCAWPGQCTHRWVRARPPLRHNVIFSLHFHYAVIYLPGMHNICRMQ